MTITHLEKRAFHAINRGKQRYGFTFDRNQLAAFRRRISDAMNPDTLSGGCVKLYQQTQHLSHWALWHGGEWIAMVYDEEMMAVVTFLPKNYLRKHKAKLPW